MKWEPYRQYRNCGVQWLGQIPEHWITKRLKATASCNDEAIADNTDDQLAIRYLDISSVSGENGIERVEEMTFGEAPSRARRIVRHGDTIISTVRTYLKAVAPIRNPPENLIVSTGFAVIRPSEEIFPDFLSYYLQSDGFVGEIQARSVGVSYPAINASEVMTLPISLPPLPEQQAIADFLGREIAKVDNLIARQEKLIHILQHRRQLIVSKVILRGLDASAPLNDTGNPWIGKIPSHWTVTRLKYVAEVRSGATKGRDLSGQATITVPYMRVANVQDGYLDLDDVANIEIAVDELDRFRLEPGDVLMNEGGDNDKLGRGHIWRGEISPCIHQNHVFAVRPFAVEPEWLNWANAADYARSFFLSRAKQSTNLASISSTNLRELPIPYPPEAERQEIVAHLDRETSRISALIAKARHVIDLMREHRSALIAAAVTGKIDVREANV